MSLLSVSCPCQFLSDWPQMPPHLFHCILYSTSALFVECIEFTLIKICKWHGDYSTTTTTATKDKKWHEYYLRNACFNDLLILRFPQILYRSLHAVYWQMGAFIIFSFTSSSVCSVCNRKSCLHRILLWLHLSSILGGNGGSNVYTNLSSYLFSIDTIENYTIMVPDGMLILKDV